MNVNERIMKALISHINFKGLDVELYPKFVGNNIDLIDENVEIYTRGGYFDNHMLIYTFISAIEKETIIFEFPINEDESIKNKYTKEYITNILSKLLNYEYVVFHLEKEQIDKFLEINKLVENKKITFKIKDGYKEMYESILYLIERLEKNTIYFYFKDKENEKEKNYIEKLSQNIQSLL